MELANWNRGWQNLMTSGGGSRQERLVWLLPDTDLYCIAVDIMLTQKCKNPKYYKTVCSLYLVTIVASYPLLTNDFLWPVI